MKALQKTCISLFCFVLLYGCTSIKQAILHGFQQSPQRVYQQRAIVHEKQAEFQQALMAWRVAEQFDSKDKKIQTAIQTLEKKIYRTANEYYNRGVDYHIKGDMDGARKNLLIALRINPDHKKALSYLKFRLANDATPVYKVVRGDSYTKIATEVYNDPTKAYAIAFFNDLNPRRPLQIGAELVLPELHSKYIVPRKDIDAMKERAKKALEQHRYEEVLEIASDIEKLQPNDHSVTQFRDQVHFERGKALLDRKEYTRAIAQLKEVSPNYPGRKEAIRKAQQHLRKEAVETRISQAQRSLDRKAYAESIAICEEILKQDPFNKDAKTIFNSAHYQWGKKLLDEGKEAEAIEIFSVLDKGYQDTGQLLTQTRAQLHARADALYRKGVRFFLNEDLEKAINAWSEALKLNPDHPKAKQDIENAIRLLDKWRDLDKNGETKNP